MSRDVAGGYLNGGDAASVDIIGTALTLAGWIWADNVGTAQGIFTKESNSGSNGQYSMLTATPSGTLRWRISDNSGSPDTCDSAAGALVTNRWQHICGVKDGTAGGAALRSYIDGVQAAAVASTRIIVNSGNDFRVGNRHPGSESFDGRVAEVAIWDVALTAGEVLALAKGAAPSRIRLPNLRGYWPIFAVGASEFDMAGRQALSVNGAIAAYPLSPPTGRLAGSPGWG
jgi:hypothetical protein